MPDIAETDHDAQHGEQEPQGLEGLLGVGDGDDEQPDGVVGDGEEQQEGDGRVAVAEDEPRHHVAERDVGRAGDRPAAAQLVELSEQKRSDQVEACRDDHAASSGDERGGSLPRIAERAARQEGLPDFLARDREEERHPHVVDEVVEVDHPVVAVERAEPGAGQLDQAEVEQGLVGLVVDVRPHQADRRPEEQEERVLEQEADCAPHARMLRGGTWIRYRAG
jgi:hypothetical protein